MTSIITSISKTLSANDTGETGGHQSGILVPRERRLLSFFPALNETDYNPRAHLKLIDESGSEWQFAFIHYNNKLFGGTRNEYRLTRMTRFFREAQLTAGDVITLSRSPAGQYHIEFERQFEQRRDSQNVLRLGSGWKIIDIDGGA